MGKRAKEPKKDGPMRVPQLDQMPLPRYTRHTILDPDTFAIEIKYIPIPGSMPAPDQKKDGAKKRS